MDGVSDNDKRITGGFVPINANNDNGGGWKDSGHHIPKLRDFEVSGEVPNEKDLVRVKAVFLPKDDSIGTVKLSLTQSSNGKIKLWQKKTKGQPFDLEKSYKPSELPVEFWVEGIAEDFSEREITLNWELTPKDDKPKASDQLLLSVTPILKSLSVTAAAGAFPDAVQRQVGWVVASEGKTGAASFNYEMTAITSGLPAGTDMVYLQTAQNTNAAVGGAVILDKATQKVINSKFDFGFDPQVNNILIDIGPHFPIYENKRKVSTSGNLTTINDVDAPALPLETVPSTGKSVLPPTEDLFTLIQVQYKYVTYGACQFADGSIWFVGSANWSVGYQGLFYFTNGNSVYELQAANKDNSSSPFIHNNSNPVLEPPAANGAKAGWRAKN